MSRVANNLCLYRIKHYLLFKKNVLTNFAKRFKFLKNINVSDFVDLKIEHNFCY